MVAPVIPGLTDHEMPAIVAATAAAGARFAGYTVLRLPYAVAELFERWLEQHFPAKKQCVLGRLGVLRGGKRNDARFGWRMRGEGRWPRCTGTCSRWPAGRRASSAAVRPCRRRRSAAPAGSSGSSSNEPGRGGQSVGAGQSSCPGNP